jgi:hypothetical protein
VMHYFERIRLPSREATCRCPQRATPVSPLNLLMAIAGAPNAGELALSVIPRSLWPHNRLAGRRPALPLRHRHGYAAVFPHGLMAGGPQPASESSQVVGRALQDWPKFDQVWEPANGLRGLALVPLVHPPALLCPARAVGGPPGCPADPVTGHPARPAQRHAHL